MVSYSIDTAVFKLVNNCLNPYCSGRWSRTQRKRLKRMNSTSLNPYCSGRWSRTLVLLLVRLIPAVLILIVVEDGLVLIFQLNLKTKSLES